jgi:catechol 2,3-dioxygenase-like lactoylglutathione lyase family enzyme
MTKEDLAAENQRAGPIPGRLSLVSLGVSDMVRERRFYEGLGWRTRSTGDDFAAFPLGGAVLALYPTELLAKEANLEPSRSEGFRGFTCAVNVNREEDVDRAIDAVREAGGTVLAEPVTREWGGRSAYFADPEGNVWEVAWLPGAKFDDRGGLFWPF